LKLVIDANVAIAAAAANPVGFKRFRRFELVAPPLMWIEAVPVRTPCSGAASCAVSRPSQCVTAYSRLPYDDTSRMGLSRKRVGCSGGDGLGCRAKTYDANYVSLARLLGCRLITLDARMRRGTSRLGFVVGPTELDGR
jgi:hypothetical protein